MRDDLKKKVNKICYLERIKGLWDWKAQLECTLGPAIKIVKEKPKEGYLNYSENLDNKSEEVTDREALEEQESRLKEGHYYRNLRSWNKNPWKLHIILQNLRKTSTNLRVNLHKITLGQKINALDHLKSEQLPLRRKQTKISWGVILRRVWKLINGGGDRRGRLQWNDEQCQEYIRNHSTTPQPFQRSLLVWRLRQFW